VIQTMKLTCKRCREPYTYVLGRRKDSRLPSFCTACRHNRGGFNDRLEFSKKKAKDA